MFDTFNQIREEIAFQVISRSRIFLVKKWRSIFFILDEKWMKAASTLNRVLEVNIRLVSC